MTTHPSNLLMINTKVNLLIHRIQIQGIIKYVDSNVNIEPGRAIRIYSGGL